MKKILRKSAGLALLMALSACSIFEGKGDEIIFDKTLGPATATQIADLPKTLEGDKDHAVYMNEPRKGEHMESTDGTE